MNIEVGMKYEVACGGKWWNQIKEILEVNEEKQSAIVVIRTDYEECNWTSVVYFDDKGKLRTHITCQFDKSLLDELDWAELHTFLNN